MQGSLESSMGNPLRTKVSELSFVLRRFPICPDGFHRDTPHCGVTQAIQKLQLRNINFVLFVYFVVAI
jgi:hypothetical protein